MIKMKRQRISREVFSSLSRPISSASSPFISLKRFSTTQKTQSVPFTITVSKKEVSTAVKRNLIKRRYTSILQKLLQKSNQYAMIQCLVKKKAFEGSFKVLTDDVIGLLTKVGL